MNRVYPAALLLFACARATAVTGDVSFDRANLQMSTEGGQTVVSIAGFASTWEVGAPTLPVAVYRFVIPQGMAVSAVQLTGLETDPVEGAYRVYPVQEPRPVSSDEPPGPTPPDPRFYGASPYPGQVAVAGSQGMMFGYNIASVVVAPVQYTASEEKLVFHPRVAFSLVLQPDEGYRKTCLNRSDSARDRIEEQLGRVVTNPQDLSRFAP
jgi:hypothetical protein